MKNGNQPAFAKAAFYHPDGGVDTPQQGLTKREYFAGLAMQGLLANPDLYVDMKIGQEAVALADELLAELDKPTKTE
jgi:hypothetical protein